ncbi:molybdopterin molybdotransferase MoeA [Campylobacter geochelonis]|uniref:molybdopterin molybdotransferase MoeA n=1 Tax=Campylobacter geochelonis TaxID=1780362 RepID=UPI00077073E0|nr:molybdopterin molybdotransferase MoeA [Campylobacter geochelonis]CZE49881.1 diguanylate cyclase/phosphodiesterase [Campylobacter geochelonis]
MFQSYEESLKILKKHTTEWNRVEKVVLTEALGRILATDIVAKENYPSHETSAMDGYACRFCDFDGVENAELKLLGDVPAGALKNVKLGKNECIKTFTGSLMCEDSDTLVPIENVLVKDGVVKITNPVKRGFAVRKVGESYKKDEVLITKGTKLSYSEIALLAELGEYHISVFIKPKIAVLSTGSEIKDLGETLEHEAQIRSSNHVAIASMAKLMGCEAQILPIVKDEPNLVKEAIINGLQGCDILITTGGVSVGDYDFVKGALNQNCEVIINGAAIKPGRHIKVAKFNDKFIFALPGFPYSAMVMCVLYVRVLLDSFFGSKSHEINAVLSEDYKKKSPFLEFVACNIEVNQNGVVMANLKGKKDGSSAIVNNLNSEAALLIVPLELDGYKKGDVVKILKMV